MPKHDPLLGVSQKPAADRNRKSAAMGVILVGLVVALALLAGFFLGRRQSEIGDSATKSAPQPVSVPDTKASPKAVAILKSSPSPKPERISLGRLSEADSNDLEMGCMGTFTSQGRDVLYVSGGTLIFRPDNDRVIASVSDEEFQAFADDDGTVNASGYRLRLVSRGLSRPAFDGHSVKAMLTVSKGIRADSLVGIWAFGC